MDQASTGELSARGRAGEEPQPLAAAVGSLTIPVVREKLDIRKHRLTTGIVRIRKIVNEREESVEEPVRHTHFEIERVAVNKTVATPPPVRQEGDTTVYPVVEEVLVITKRYLVKEEVRITHRISESTRQQHFWLRSEELVIEREDRGKADQT